MFALDVFRRGQLIERVREKNLVVDAGKAPMARLLGGTVTGNSVTTIGFGTSGTTPALGNTALTGAFTKALGTIDYPVAGQVRFAFSLLTSEANGLAILEFGLFTGAGALFARKTRTTALNKDVDLSLTGTWIITF